MNGAARAILALLILAMLLPVASPALAQVRRPGARLLRRLEKMEERQKNKKPAAGQAAGERTEAPASPAQGNSLAPRTGQLSGKHSLDGIREKGPRAIFTDAERELVIPGLGNPVALLIIFRQLDLTEQQRSGIKGIRTRVGNRLAQLQNQYRQTDAQLSDAIYGDNFDPARVDELAAQAAEKQSEIIKLRAGVESQLRQLMTPDQFYVFQALIGEMVNPQRRITPLQLRQMIQRRAPGAQNNQNPE
jgi:Spy/CpxP family protein refolding chaperone